MRPLEVGGVKLEVERARAEDRRLPARGALPLRLLPVRRAARPAPSSSAGRWRACSGSRSSRCPRARRRLVRPTTCWTTSTPPEPPRRREGRRDREGRRSAPARPRATAGAGGPRAGARPRSCRRRRVHAAGQERSRAARERAPDRAERHREDVHGRGAARGAGRPRLPRRARLPRGLQRAPARLRPPQVLRRPAELHRLRRGAAALHGAPQAPVHPPPRRDREGLGRGACGLPRAARRGPRRPLRTASASTPAPPWSR